MTLLWWKENSEFDRFIDVKDYLSTLKYVNVVKFSNVWNVCHFLPKMIWLLLYLTSLFQYPFFSPPTPPPPPFVTGNSKLVLAILTDANKNYRPKRVDQLRHTLFSFASAVLNGWHLASLSGSEFDVFWQTTSCFWKIRTMGTKWN